MSNVSTAHTVTTFDAKKSQPLSGQRLAKIRYKTTAKQDAKYPSVCVSVPFVGSDIVSENLSRLMPYVLELVQGAQDGVIRSLYESSQGSLSLVTDDDISISACISYLEAESQGTRLTKEFIEAWFDASVSDYIVALIAEKLGYGDSLTPEQEHTVGKHVKGYKDLYASLAGGKTVLQENQIKSLGKVLELVDSDDTSEKLKARLNGMLNKPKIEELLEL